MAPSISFTQGGRLLGVSASCTTGTGRESLIEAFSSREQPTMPPESAVSSPNRAANRVLTSTLASKLSVVIGYYDAPPPNGFGGRTSRKRSKGRKVKMPVLSEHTVHCSRREWRSRSPCRRYRRRRPTRWTASRPPETMTNMRLKVSRERRSGQYRGWSFVRGRCSPRSLRQAQRRSEEHTSELQSL